MVIDQPATEEELAAGLDVTVAVVEDLLAGPAAGL
jgi:segregation and condensation protein B